MKEYKTIPTTRQQLIDLSCDICKKKAKHPSIGWQDGQYQVNETEIRHRTGDSFPGGGSGHEISVDICPECFQIKLIPWLQDQGCKISKREWDY